MVELLIMRHAKSAWDSGDSDFDRPLSDRGERDAPRMAAWIAEHNLAPEIDDLVDLLSADEPPLSSSGKLMTTAAVAHLRFDTPWAQIAQRSGHLMSLTRPRELNR